MADTKEIVIVCGEPSGDLHAGILAGELRKLDPSIRIRGVGGPRLAEHADEIICGIDTLAVLGVFDVLTKLPRFLALKKRLLREIRAAPPRAVILVDFSGFNLRLLQALPPEIPVFYYVSPQVWASRPGRIAVIRRHIRRMIVFFRFEEALYRQHGVPVTCVGHPLLDIVRPSAPRDALRASMGLAADTQTIALLPGSRTGEITRILPVMARAVVLINKKIPGLQCVIAQSPHVPESHYQTILKNAGINAKLVVNKTYDTLNASDCALVCSGTATLETALLGIPVLIIYRMSQLNYLLYRPQVTIPHIGMVNIIAQKEIIPEFIQQNATPAAIAAKALEFLTNQQKLAQMHDALTNIRSLLGEPGAAERAAKVVLDNLKE